MKRGDVTDNSRIQGPQHSGDPDGHGSGGLHLLPFAGLVLALACVLASGVDHYVTPSAFAFHMGDVRAWTSANPLVAALAFLSVTATVLAISLPGGAAAMAIAGGALFGLGIGAALYVVAATAGSVALYLAARPAMGGLMRRKSGLADKRVYRMVRRASFWLVTSMRLIPPIPPAFVTLAAAAAGMTARSFALATMLGLAPGALMLGYLGSALPSGVAPPMEALWRWPEIAVMLSLAALAIMPSLARRWWPRPADV